MTSTNEKKGDLHARAIDLYTPPFRFEFGYIWDAKGQMVADNHVPDESEGAALRVRGWGRISYLEDPEALQDEVGNIIAAAMTEHWQRQNYGFTNEPVADVVAWHKEGEERTCDIRWRRFDVAPGPLYTVPQPVPQHEFTIRENGEANSYTLLKDGNWFASILMNGEMTVPQQWDFLNTIAKKQ